jgi:alkanesulfonate monooxygenase SsuD/methylene tetrahydromethanopterin reductase-like flavin-dependent oxidoreductase (luciferase family)
MTAALKVGVQLPEDEYVARWPELRDMAVTAEEIGLDSIWLGDHLVYREPGKEPKGPWECLTLLSSLAAVTERVELGPLVLAAGFRNPAVTAKMAETIDEISGGRLILGLGAGWNEAEFRAFDIPYDHRVSRFEESFAIIHGLLRDGAISFSGEFNRLEDCVVLPRGPRPGRIPLMVGSTGERMLRLTLPYVDAWNIWFADFGNTAGGLRPFLDQVDRIATEVGRDPGEIDRTAAVLVSMGDTPGRARVPASVVPIRGTASDIAASLREIHDVGIGHIQLVLDPITPATVAALAPVVQALRTGSAG